MLFLVCFRLLVLLFTCVLLVFVSWLVVCFAWLFALLFSLGLIASYFICLCIVCAYFMLLVGLFQPFFLLFCCDSVCFVVCLIASFSVLIVVVY